MIDKKQTGTFVSMRMKSKKPLDMRTGGKGDQVYIFFAMIWRNRFMRSIAIFISLVQTIKTQTNLCKIEFTDGLQNMILWCLHRVVRALSPFIISLKQTVTKLNYCCKKTLIFLIWFKGVNCHPQKIFSTNRADFSMWAVRLISMWGLKFSFE